MHSFQPRRAALARQAVRWLVAAGLLLAVARGPSVLYAQSEGSTYTVVSGDTLGEIAARFEVPLDALVSVNGIADPNQIRVGQQLIIPNADGSLPLAAIPTGTVTANAGDSLAMVANRYGLDPAFVGELNGVSSGARLFPGQPIRLPEEAVPPASLRFGAVVDVELPETLIQGRTGRVYVTAERPVVLSGSWNDRPLTFTSIDAEGLRYFAFLPTHALQEPNVYGLTLGYTTAAGVEVSRSWPVTVEAGSYDFQEIVIPEDRASVLEPDVVQAELAKVIEVWSQASPSLYWQDPFVRPIGAEYATTSPFGTRRSYSVGGISDYHAGQDFGAPVGTPVTAPAPGVVALAEPLIVRGNAVLIDHGRGVFSGYWHMSELQVEPGQWVNAGDLIGLVGNTGLSTGAHLHWELRINGIAVDPTQFLDEGAFGAP
ncbi:MAG: peptidoglycan DD-metalloendopeptidase family protein [Caldilineaceae bacterium]|nr:peptidoglycan DD-metalloendopeptidase family protein [Caldilineaceae bacterium]